MEPQYNERRSTMKTRLILVGGFLGAGKTTLLWEAAQRLAGRGLKVGLITNDQAPELVDTAFLARGNVNIAEVSGSCFCCNFQGLLDAMAKVREEAAADVLIAEPVGSCTDLSATIVQPLRDRLAGTLVVAPLSVLADPGRLSDILNGGTAGLHPSAAYIFRKQLEEADIVVISKTDLLPGSDLEALKLRVAQAYPGATVVTASVKTGEGLETWLDEVTIRSDAGQRLAEVDYDVYAEGEAVLGWLNATFTLHGEPTEWNAFAERLLRGLSRRFDSLGAAVGHVKLMLEAGDDFLVGNLTGRSATLTIRGSAGAGPEARLTLNARVQMPPETLEAIAREVLAAAADQGRITATPVAWRCLSPGRPKPTHRYAHVVPSIEA
jgi:G3E family GTPase